MSLWSWFVDIFNKLLAIFKKFIEDAFAAGSKILIAEFKDFAILVVTELKATDLTNEQKRAEAISRIKAEALARGKVLNDSLVNTLVELAYQYVINNT